MKSTVRTRRLRGPQIAVAALAASLLAASSSPAAPASADVTLYVNAGIRHPVDIYLGDGAIKAVPQLTFISGIHLEVSGSEATAVSVRFALPDGLHWGLDAPKETEGCTSTAQAAECKATLDPNNPDHLRQHYVAFWDVVAERPGQYALRAEIVEMSANDPDPSNNKALVTVDVTAPPSGGGGGSVGGSSGSAVVASTVLFAPAKPRAGALMTASVGLSSGGTAIKPSAVTCAGRVGMTKVAGRATAALGKATCRYRPPASARGKTLRGAVALTAKGQRITRRFAVRLG